MVLSDRSFFLHERKVFMKYARVLTASVMLAWSALAAEAYVVDASSGHAPIAAPAPHALLEEHPAPAFDLQALAARVLDNERIVGSAPTTVSREQVAANLAAGEHAGKAASPGDVITKGTHSTKRALRRFARKLKRMTRGEAEQEDPRHAPEVP